MKYMMGKSLDKDDEYLTFLDEFFKDISSWTTLHMIYDNSLDAAAIEIMEILESKHVRPFVYYGGDKDKFRDFINNGDCLLAVGDGEEFIINSVEIAKSKEVKVYGICSDVKSPLISLSDEVLVITNDFENHMNLFIKTLAWKYLAKKDRPIIDPHTPGSYLSSFLGSVIDVKVKIGDTVKKGDVLCVLEAMKMEENIVSDVDGVVENIFIKPGDQVAFEEVIMIIK